MQEKIKKYFSSMDIVPLALSVAVIAGLLFLLFCMTFHPFTKVIDAAESPFEIDVSQSGNGLYGDMTHISINTNPVFTKGTGNVNIVNSGVNNYSQIVEIVRNDNEQCIFRSGTIPVGERCDTGKLINPPKRGTYDCTAIFHSIDDDGVEVGTAAAYIKVIIK